MTPAEQSDRFAAVEELARRLQTGDEHVTWTPTARQPDGVIAFGYPSYPKWLIDGLSNATDYLEHSPSFDIKRAHDIYGALLDRERSFPIDAATAEEVWANFTYATRGERFVDGYIASMVENGIVAGLVEGLLQRTRGERS